MPFCPYFAQAVREVAVPGLSRPMRVAACRCALTEEAVSRLLTHPDGVELADAFTSTTPERKQWPLLGPDLEEIAAYRCTQTRHDAICVPAFATMLTSFDLESDLPAETTVRLPAYSL